MEVKSQYPTSNTFKQNLEMRFLQLWYLATHVTARQRLHRRPAAVSVPILSAEQTPVDANRRPVNARKLLIRAARRHFGPSVAVLRVFCAEMLKLTGFGDQYAGVAADFVTGLF